LTTFLSHLGHEAIIINRDFARPSIIRIFLSFCKRLCKKILLRKNIELFPFYTTNEQRVTISKNTLQFISTYIPCTKKLTSTKGLKSLINQGYSYLLTIV
jgi:hypothetical protein